MRKRSEKLILQTISLFRIGTRSPLTLKKLSKVVFNSFSLSKLPNLSIDAGDHLQQLLVRFPDFRTEGFDYSPNVTAHQNRKAKCPSQSFTRSHNCARKVLVRRDIIDPDWFAELPDSSW